MLNITIQSYNWNEVDTVEIAQLLLTVRRESPFWRPDWNLDWFQEFIRQRIERFSPSFVILARARGKLVGMTGIITADPTLYDLWRWHPVVLQEENEDEIAVALIKAGIQHMQAAGIHSIEVVFDFTLNQSFLLIGKSCEINSREIGSSQFFEIIAGIS